MSLFLSQKYDSTGSVLFVLKAEPETALPVYAGLG